MFLCNKYEIAYKCKNELVESQLQGIIVKRIGYNNVKEVQFEVI